MTTPQIDLAAALAELVHDVLGALGTVRLSVTAARDEPDAEFRGTLLDGAEHEIGRLSALVSAIGPLVAAANDSLTAAVPAADLAHDVVDLAARRRVQVEVAEATGTVAVPPAGPAVVAALAGLVSDNGPVALTVWQAGESDAVVTLTPSRTPARREERITSALVSMIGGRLRDAEAGVTFELGGAE